MALDLGSRRTGVAISGPGGTMALAHSVVERSGDGAADLSALARLVAEVGASKVVVGLPLSLDGGRGPAAERVEAEVEALGALLDVPVEVADERFTTAAAHRSLAGAGVRSRGRRPVVDSVAAAVLLQSWLDRKAHGGAQP